MGTGIFDSSGGLRWDTGDDDHNELDALDDDDGRSSFWTDGNAGGTSQGIMGKFAKRIAQTVGLGGDQTADRQNKSQDMAGVLASLKDTGNGERHGAVDNRMSRYGQSHTPPETRSVEPEPAPVVAPGRERSEENERLRLLVDRLQNAGPNGRFA